MWLYIIATAKVSIPTLAAELTSNFGGCHISEGEGWWKDDDGLVDLEPDVWIHVLAPAAAKATLVEIINQHNVRAGQVCSLLVQTPVATLRVNRGGLKK